MEPFVGIEEAAKFLAVKKSWLYEQVRFDRAPSYKIGAFRRFRLTELEAWARRQGNGNGSEPLCAPQGVTANPAERKAGP